MRRLFYTLLVILALATAASANTAIFNDETSFLSALQSGYYLEDFNNFTYGTYYYDPLGFGPTNDFSYRMSSPLRGLFSLDGKMSNLESTETIIIDFTGSPFPVKAVGGKFWPTDIEGQNLGGNIALSLSDGTQLNLTNADFTTFRGFISDGAAFTYMRISTGGGGTEIWYPTVDHLYIGQPAPAPNQPPVANAGPDQTVSVGPDCIASVILDATGSSDPDKDVLTYTWTGPFGTASGPAPTVNLPLGTHTITLTVNDGKGGTSSDTVVIALKDTTPPTPGIPSLPTINGQCSAEITTIPTATDNCSGTVIARTSDPLIYTKQGTYSVTWTFEDQNQNITTQTQTVIVKDNTPPTITALPNITVYTGPNTTSCGKVVTDAALGAPTIADNCSGVSYTRTGVPLNNLFPTGTTTITYTAKDASGNTATATQTVTVIDNTKPVITNVSATPSELWPPNKKMVDVTINYTATDNCDQPACQISSVTCNEPINSSDYTIVDAHHVKLRADRLGSGNGRIYTITITCTDSAGNPTNQTVEVKVPHDQGKK